MKISEGTVRVAITQLLVRWSAGGEGDVQESIPAAFGEYLRHKKGERG